MDKYAFYIFTAFGFTALLLFVTWLRAFIALRRAEKRLSTLQKTRNRRDDS